MISGDLYARARVRVSESGIHLRSELAHLYVHDVNEKVWRSSIYSPKVSGKGPVVEASHCGSKSVWPQRHNPVTCLQFLLWVEQELNKINSIIYVRSQSFPHYQWSPDYIPASISSCCRHKTLKALKFLSPKIYSFLFTLPSLFPLLSVYFQLQLGRWQETFPLQREWLHKHLIINQ